MRMSHNSYKMVLYEIVRRVYTVDKACQAAITDGGLLTDTGENERGENERKTQKARSRGIEPTGVGITDLGGND